MKPAQKKLILKALDNIEKYPDHFYMGAFALRKLDLKGPKNICNTTCCFAGHIIVAAGIDINKRINAGGCQVFKVKDIPKKYGITQRMNISYLAQTLAGFSADEANKFFYEFPNTNSVEKQITVLKKKIMNYINKNEKKK